MISVLIPVFNRNLVELVQNIHRQVDSLDKEMEIVVMDDCSTDQQLKKINCDALNALPFVRHIQLPSNIGRNLIRQQLASVAKYDTLIFIDADSSFPDDQWLNRYLTANDGKSIVTGGRMYRDTLTNQLLHVHYGRKREQRTASYRAHHPYRSFIACNFLILKEQLAGLLFDPHLHGYCHEDTFMGLQFEKMNIPVLHINNPVYHDGIDADDVFMNKQAEAIENLYYLDNTYRYQFNFLNGVKLIRVYGRLANNLAGKFVLNQLAARETLLKKKVFQKKSLFWLDCWKLAKYHQLSRHAD